MSGNYIDEEFEEQREAQIRILVVEPGNLPYLSTVGNDFKSMQVVVGRMIEYVQLEENVNLVCNEEGKLLNLKGNRRLGDDIIAGTFFISGSDSYGGDISLTDEQISVYSERFAVPEHYSDEQVQAAVYCTVTGYGNTDDFLDALLGRDRDDGLEI